MFYKQHDINAIVVECRIDNNYHRIARKFGVGALRVRTIDVLHNKRFVVSEDGKGRPELRKHTICVKHVDAPWPDSEAIAKARSNYNLGLIEMCTARDGLHNILYAIPRKVRHRDRKQYFRVVA